MKRDLIEKNEGRLSILQIVGFAIIIFGIIVIFIGSFFDASRQIAITFFITMLGVAFAFPSLLKGDEGLSTMRIVVFMMTNVICMLLLKLGWPSEVRSLEAIGLDQYWMGVIAFIFGAKATQSFFESRMAVPKEESKDGMAGVEYSGADIARLAKAQNEQFLISRFPNILEVSDAVDDLSRQDSHVIALYLKDNNSAGIPNTLIASLPDGSKRKVAVEIISGNGSGAINFNQEDKISKGRSKGSICCKVVHDDGDMVVSAGHVFSDGNDINYGGTLDVSDHTDMEINGQKAGTWYFQLCNFKHDVALARLDPGYPTNGLVSFHGKGHYQVTDADVKKTKVLVISHVSIPRVRDAYIIDHNTAWDVPYDNKISRKSKVIVIGTKPSRVDSLTVSQKGDSGGCVYEPDSGKLVGLILGGNSKVTWVLSVEDVFEKFNFKLA